jgi:hypothetical protein
MNVYLVSPDPDLRRRTYIKAHDAEGAAERAAPMLWRCFDASMATLFVRDVRDRIVGRVTVEITPRRMGNGRTELEAIAIGSRFPIEIGGGPAL